MLECLFVGLGGFIGSVARYLIGLLAVETASGFPVKTFCINLLGSFILGIVSESALRDPGISQNLVLFLQIGVCGGFTTFSTFSSEALKLFAGGRQGVALSYMVLSVVLGLVCCYGGWLVARMR
ncbi:MAG: fluoride efflux transporter CrcB [Peptococcaceae bacterium]|nr:fluoride efflux transporter CrcB [Peptococcaceae bacterium]